MPSTASKANKMERHVFATHTVEKGQLSLICKMLIINEKMMNNPVGKKRVPGHSRRVKGKERHMVNKRIKLCSASSRSKETQIKMKYFVFTHQLGKNCKV